MSSIFKLEYIHNLNRINSKADSSDRVERKNSGFSELLADIEKREQLSKQNQLLVKEQARMGEISSTDNVLSNFKQQDVKTSSEGLTYSTKSAVDPKAESALVGVKSPAVPVKITPAMGQIANNPIAVEVRNTPSSMTNKAIAAFNKISETAGSVPRNAIQNIIRAAGRFHGLDPHLALAVAKAESSFNTKAVSSDGHNSKGLFQLLDTTARDMIKRLGVSSKYRPFDAGHNSHLGVGYLRYLHDIFSTPTELAKNLKTYPAKTTSELEKLAVAAFNVGEGAVAEAQARAKNSGLNPGEFSAIKKYLPASTRDYVARVSDYKNDYDDKNTKTDVL